MQDMISLFWVSLGSFYWQCWMFQLTLIHEHLIVLKTQVFAYASYFAAIYNQ